MNPFFPARMHQQLIIKALRMNIYHKSNRIDWGVGILTRCFCFQLCSLGNWKIIVLSRLLTHLALFVDPLMVMSGKSFQINYRYNFNVIRHCIRSIRKIVDDSKCLKLCLDLMVEKYGVISKIINLNATILVRSALTNTRCQYPDLFTDHM